MKTRKGYVVKLVYPGFNNIWYELRNFHDNWRVFKTRSAAIKVGNKEKFENEKVVVMKYTRVYG